MVDESEAEAAKIRREMKCILDDPLMLDIGEGPRWLWTIASVDLLRLVRRDLLQERNRRQREMEKPR